MALEFPGRYTVQHDGLLVTICICANIMSHTQNTTALNHQFELSRLPNCACSRGNASG